MPSGFIKEKKVRPDIKIKQLDIFADAKKRRDSGIKRAVDHADQVHDNWSNAAFIFLNKFMRDHAEFMTEDVRVAAQGVLPEPPDPRAWGAVITRAYRSGLIKRIGYAPVRHFNAHMRPAAVWSTNVIVKQNAAKIY